MAKVGKLKINFSKACEDIARVKQVDRITKKELANMINYSNQSLSDLETGKTKPPKVIQALQYIKSITGGSFDDYIEFVENE